MLITAAPHTARPPRCARAWCNIVITRVSNLYGNERIINNLRFPCSLLQRAHFYPCAERATFSVMSQLPQIENKHIPRFLPLTGLNKFGEFGEVATRGPHCARPVAAAPSAKEIGATLRQ